MPTATLKLYAPHSVQRMVHEATLRFRFVVCAWGRQSGKSTWAVNQLLKCAWENPGKTYWFVAPVYSQALVQYRRLLRQLHNCPGALIDKNKTELWVQLKNRTRIFFKSGEVFDNLRTETLDGVVIDEYREQHPDLWPLIISPMLLTTGGWCAFISTTNGYDAFNDLIEKAKHDTTGEWTFFEAPSTCNPLITPERVAAIRSQMSEQQFQQEIMAKVVNLRQGKVYANAGPHNELTVSPFVTDGHSLHSPYLPIVVGMDFNVNPMAWHLGQFRARTSYWFDEIHIADTNTPECAEELVERLKVLGGYNPETKEYPLFRARPMVKLCGDVSGNARNTKATEEDYDIVCNALRKAGITYYNDTPKENPPIKARVLTMNGHLKAADGTVTLFFHPIRCPFLKKDFERVGWKPGAQVVLDPGLDNQLTHDSDSVGYPVCVYAPIELAGGVGKLYVIPSKA